MSVKSLAIIVEVKTDSCSGNRDWIRMTCHQAEDLSENSDHWRKRRMMVYVLTKKGTPVMPTRPVVARLLLKQGKAKVTRRTPFTIKLHYALEKEYIQELQTGLDTGSGTFGAAVTNKTNDVLYMSQVQLRNDIKKKMNQRRQYRRTRRTRKCRYRPKNSSMEEKARDRSRASLKAERSDNSRARPFRVIT